MNFVGIISISGSDVLMSVEQLLLAAFAPELAPFADLELPMATVGVGLVEAALGTIAALAIWQPKRVCLVGTVGAYPQSGLSLCAIVCASKVGLVVADGELPQVIPQELDAKPFGAFAHARVATTLGVTVSDANAALLGARFEVEHLEAFAVARACATQNVVFSGVFAVANAVGALGRREWLLHHERASAVLADALRASLVPC